MEEGLARQIGLSEVSVADIEAAQVGAASVTLTDDEYRQLLEAHT